MRRPAFAIAAKRTIFPGKPVLWTFFLGSLFSGASLSAQTLSSDTLIGQVVHWEYLRASSSHRGTSRQILNGPTHDLAQLDIKALTLDTGVIVAAYGSEADEMIIVRDGQLDVSTGDTGKVLGPGGIALFGPGEKYSLENGGHAPVTYYIFRWHSRGTKDQSRAGSPLLIDWPEMTMKKTDKGESRQILSRPVVWLGRLDMHATTLDPGQVSHAPHTHRAEEIILMRSGNVEEYIGGKYYKAAAGDLIFLPSGVPHALENKGTGRCEYFALQWTL